MIGLHGQQPLILILMTPRWGYFFPTFVWLSIFLSVVQFVSERILMKFSGQLSNGTKNNWVNSGDDLDQYQIKKMYACSFKYTIIHSWLTRYHTSVMSWMWGGLRSLSSFLVTFAYFAIILYLMKREICKEGFVWKWRCEVILTRKKIVQWTKTKKKWKRTPKHTLIPRRQRVWGKIWTCVFWEFWVV